MPSSWLRGWFKERKTTPSCLIEAVASAYAEGASGSPEPHGREGGRCPCGQGCSRSDATTRHARVHRNPWPDHTHFLKMRHLPAGLPCKSKKNLIHHVPFCTIGPAFAARDSPAPWPRPGGEALQTDRQNACVPFKTAQEPVPQTFAENATIRPWFWAFAGRALRQHFQRCKPGLFWRLSRLELCLSDLPLAIQPLATQCR